MGSKKSVHAGKWPHEKRVGPCTPQDLTHGYLGESVAKEVARNEKRVGPLTFEQITYELHKVSIARDVARILGIPYETGDDFRQVLKVVSYCKFASVEEALVGMFRLSATVVEAEFAEGRPVRLPFGSRGDSIDLLAYAGIRRSQDGGG